MQIDAPTVIAIASAVTDHVQQCYTHERFHADAIQALAAAPGTTLEMMDAYDISDGWP